MARKPVQRQLPPLTEQATAFHGFDSTETKSVGLERWLRQIATRCRGAKPQPFYSMRTVARFFGVTLPTVGRVYQQLEREGLLLRKRSSMTVLSPVKAARQVIHHGIVAVPIWLPGFLVFRDWRLFFIELEEQLRQHRYVANLIFFRVSEEVDPDFVQRLLAHQPEHIIWLTPAAGDAHTLEMLGDAGIRLVVLGNEPGLSFRGQRYLLSWQQGLRRCLAAWKAAGIRTVLIPQSNGPTHASATRLASQLVPAAGIACLHPRPGQTSLPKYLEGLARRPDTAVIFDEDLWYSRLCAEAPRSVAGLLQRARVLVLRPPNLSAGSLGATRVDSLSHAWQSIARRVAHDLHTGAVFSDTPPTVFEAEWKPRLAATELASHFASSAIPLQ